MTTPSHIARLLTVVVLFTIMVFTSCREQNIADLPTDLDTTFVTRTRYDSILLYCDTIDSIFPRVNDQVVIAYVTYYSATNDLTKIDKAPAAAPYVTHINYGFAELYVREGVYQKFALQGTESRFRSVINLKQTNPDLKILLSFTHTVSNSDNQQGGGFSAMASDSAQRVHFAEDCLAFIQKWGIDGIDIDWEFPTVSWSGHASSQEDKNNFTLLMKQLRKTLGNQYLLTYAGYCQAVYPDNLTTSKYINNIAVEPYIDWINLMCYDMCSAPQPHNAMQCDGYWDIKRTLNSYKRIKYPMHKLVLGIPFYGRHTYEDGEWYYFQIRSYVTHYPNEWEDGWDPIWKVPYLKHNGEMFCSYENTYSIRQKGQWVFDNNWRGLMYWEASGDNDNRDLAHACWHSQKEFDSTIIIPHYLIDTIITTDTIVR